MSRRQVKRVIREKLVDWINSIQDLPLREDVRSSVYVAGGAINSVMMGAPINDYDVYFKHAGTAIKVAQYYLNANADGTHLDRSTIATEYTYPGAASVNILKLGGRLLKDVGYIALPCSEANAYEVKIVTANALTMTNKLQLILKFCGPPDKVLPMFDFAHAMCYYDLNTNYVDMPPDALESMVSKSLVYKGSFFPLASLFRMRKFAGRDWSISAGQIVKIALNLNEFDLKDPHVLREQILGVDIMYMEQLYQAIEGNIAVDTAYICEIIDRIFNEGGREMGNKETYNHPGLRLNRL